MHKPKYQNIEFSIVDGLAKLVLNRPDRLNSFNAEMHVEVKSAFKRLATKGAARCLLITGSGRGFCAGQDLSDRSVSGGDQAPDLSASIRDNYNPLIRAITALEMPVIARSTASPQAPGPILRWPATSSLRPSRQALSSRSINWGWCRILEALGCCRGS